MRNLFILLLTVFCFFSSGCKTTDTSPKNKAVENLSDQKKLDYATSLLKSRRFKVAISHFAYLRDNADSLLIREKASAGLAKSFLQTNNSDSALGVLMPLPESPYSKIHALKYALTAEAFMQKELYAKACLLLETAIDVEKDSFDLYRTTAMFNLVKCYLLEGNAELATHTAEKAAKLFKKQHNQKMYSECIRIKNEVRDYMK